MHMLSLVSMLCHESLQSPLNLNMCTLNNVVNRESQSLKCHMQQKVGAQLSTSRQCSKLVCFCLFGNNAQSPTALVYLQLYIVLWQLQLSLQCLFPPFDTAQPSRISCFALSPLLLSLLFPLCPPLLESSCYIPSDDILHNLATLWGIAAWRIGLAIAKINLAHISQMLNL